MTHKVLNMRQLIKQHKIRIISIVLIIIIAVAAKYYLY